MRRRLKLSVSALPKTATFNRFILHFSVFSFYYLLDLGYFHINSLAGFYLSILWICVASVLLVQHYPGLR